MSRYLLACDAGGTMTDVIVVDEQGRFAIGKAPTTRYDESVGYMESLEEALTYWQLSMERNGREICENSETAIYTGTSMLNSLINMDGQKTGLITTRGFEDMTIQGRGSQTWIGYEWSEILHMQYRKHREPLVKRRHCRGVTERVDLFGNAVIPLYEHEVRHAVLELLDEGVEAIAIVFLNSKTHTLKMLDLLGMPGQFTAGALAYPLFTNLRWDDEDWNFLKRRQELGVTGAFNEREQRWADLGWR